MKRIGLFGGSFDPPHLVHLSAAKIALSYFLLDEIWFILSGNPPHKNQGELTDIEIRKKMLSAVIKEDKRFQLKDFEFDVSKVHYTIDTIKHILESYPNHDFYMIIGSDSYNNLLSWKNPEEIAKLVKIIVFRRPKAPLKKSLKDKFPYLLLPVIPLPISSTLIRKRVQKGLPNDRYILDEVQDIIKKYNLYTQKSIRPIRKNDE